LDSHSFAPGSLEFRAMGYPGIYTPCVMGVCHLLVGDDSVVLLDTGLVGEPWLIRWRLTHGHIDRRGGSIHA
jgi:glyoxylase-like metal-dependent hydrolase (beta-lactamase superfamily II)